jgi:hypothetical protein
MGRYRYVVMSKFDGWGNSFAEFIWEYQKGNSHGPAWEVSRAVRGQMLDSRAAGGL